MKSALVAIVWLALVGPASAQSKPTTQTESLDTLREKRKSLDRQIGNLLTVWWNLCRRRITVVRIKGLAETKGTLKEKLDNRFLALAKKRASNRQWKTYWARQQHLAHDIRSQYVALLELIPRELSLLSGKEAVLNADVVAAIKLRTALMHTITEQKKALAARLARVLRDKTMLEQQAREQQARVSALEAQLKVAETAIEAALKGKDPVQIAGRRAEKARTEAGLKLALAALKQTTTKREALETALQTVLAFQSGSLTDAAKIVDEPFRKAAIALGKAESALKELGERQTMLSASIKTYGKRRAALARRRKLILGRTAALSSWAKLAGDPAAKPSATDKGNGHSKAANQDRYFNAINEDITAVRLRLRELRKEALSKQQLPSQEAKKKTAAKGPSAAELRNPMTRYRAGLAKQRELKALRQIDIGTVNADLKMVELQLSAMKLLVRAQSIDVQLVNREVKIASDEFERCTASTVEPKKSDTWYAIWTQLAGNAATKVPTLYAEQATSEALQEILSSYAESYRQDLELLAKELKRVTSDIATEEARFRSVVWATFLYWLRAHAWFIPLVLIGAWILLLVAGRLSRAVLIKAQGDPGMNKDKLQQVETLVTVGSSVIKTVIYVAAVILLLHLIGVNVGPILGGAAIFGLAISFGSQNLVRDVVTGFFILLENQFAIGDVIEVNGVTGTVEQITLRRTVVRDLNGTQHNIPNGAISRVSNQTQGWARAVVHVGVGYSSDLDHVKNISNAVGEAMLADAEWSDKLLEPPTFVGVTELADSAVIVRVMAKTEIFHQWSAQRELTRRLKEAFDIACIEIPFPQRQVHMLASPPAPENRPAE